MKKYSFIIAFLLLSWPVTAAVNFLEAELDNAKVVAYLQKKYYSILPHP